MSAKVLTGLPPKEVCDARKKQIEEILARGNVVKFTNPFTGCVKYVDTWNEDADGDLIAFRGNLAQTHFVCWESARYDVSEVTREEVPPE